MDLSVMGTALLIIDMLNEYVSPNGKIYCEEANKIIPNIIDLRSALKELGGKVIYVNTSHLGDGDPEIQKWGQHAMRGTWGAEVTEELKPEPDDYIVYKRTYDGFYNTELEITLRSLCIKNVVAVGIHTHVCVLLTSLGAFYRGFRVIALEDCMTTGYQPNHDSRLRFYSSHIGELYKLRDFLEMINNGTNSTN